MKKFMNKLLSFLVLIYFIFTAQTTFAEEIKNVYVTHNLPSKLKIGDELSKLEDFNLYFHNLIPNKNVELYIEGLSNTELNEFGFFREHRVGDNRTVSEENGQAQYYNLKFIKSAYKSGVLNFKPKYRYFEEINGNMVFGEWIYTNDCFSIIIEDFNIDHNAPTNIKVGESFDFESFLMNNSLDDLDTPIVGESGLPSLDYSEKIYNCPAYHPSVTVVEGFDCVKREKQDYTKMLRTKEKLIFEQIGIVKLKIKYNQVVTCDSDCLHFNEESNSYNTYSPEKIVTINVVENTKIVGEIEPTNPIDIIHNDEQEEIPSEEITEIEATGIVISGKNLPVGAKIILKSVEESKQQEIKDILESNNLIVNKIFVYDINLNDINGSTVQPNGMVLVRLNIPHDFKNIEKNELKIYSLDSEGQLYELESIIIENNIFFETDHFSIYSLVQVKEADLINYTDLKKSTDNNNDNLFFPKTGNESDVRILIFFLILITSYFVILFYKKIKLNRVR